MKIGAYMLTNKSWTTERDTPLGKHKTDYERQDKFLKLTGCFIAPDKMRIVAVCKKSFVTGLTTVTVNKARYDRDELDIPVIEEYMRESFERVVAELDKKEDKFQKELLLIGRKK